MQALHTVVPKRTPKIATRSSQRMDRWTKTGIIKKMKEFEPASHIHSNHTNYDLKIAVEYPMQELHHMNKAELKEELAQIDAELLRRKETNSYLRNYDVISPSDPVLYAALVEDDLGTFDVQGRKERHTLSHEHPHVKDHVNMQSTFDEKEDAVTVNFASHRQGHHEHEHHHHDHSLPDLHTVTRTDVRRSTQNGDFNTSLVLDQQITRLFVAPGDYNNMITAVNERLAEVNAGVEFWTGERELNVQQSILQKVGNMKVVGEYGIRNMVQSHIEDLSKSLDANPMHMDAIVDIASFTSKLEEFLDNNFTLAELCWEENVRKFGLTINEVSYLRSIYFKQDSDNDFEKVQDIGKFGAAHAIEWPHPGWTLPFLTSDGWNGHNRGLWWKYLLYVGSALSLPGICITWQFVKSGN